MARSKEFVSIAEGIKSQELSLQSSLESLRSTLSSLNGEKIALENKIASLEAQLAAAENEEEPDEGLIASLEMQLEQAHEELEDKEQEISKTNIEFETTQAEYEKVEEEKQQTLFEIQQRARMTAQNITAAGGMFGAYASVGASLAQSFQSSFNALSQAASILDGSVGSVGGSAGQGGSSGGHSRSGNSPSAVTRSATAIASSNAIHSPKPSHGTVSSKQISGARSENGRFTKKVNLSHSDKKNYSQSEQNSINHEDNGAIADLSFIRNNRSGRKMVTQQASISQSENAPSSIANAAPGKSIKRERFLASLRVDPPKLAGTGAVNPNNSGAHNIGQRQMKQHEEIEISDFFVGAAFSSIARNVNKGSATDGNPQLEESSWQPRNQLLNTTVTRKMERIKDEEMQHTAFQCLWQHYKSDQWRRASIDQRKQILESFLKELNLIFGINVPKKINFEDFAPIKTENGTIGRIRGQYSKQNNSISINNYFLTAKNSYQLMLTLIHEMRHAYQYYAIKNPRKVCVSEETIKHWEGCLEEMGRYNELKKREDGYLRIAIEYDAKKFAGQRSDLHRMIHSPDYAGSWEVETTDDTLNPGIGLTYKVKQTDRGGVKQTYSDITYLDSGSAKMREQLSRGAPSLVEQAEGAKKILGAEQYLHSREEVEAAEKDFPNRKHWELTPDQLQRAREIQRKVAITEKPTVYHNNQGDSHDEQKTPGGDAWKKRFGHVEGEN